MMDEGILAYARHKGDNVVENSWTRIGEIPFDFERRMVSTILKDGPSVRPMLICKGAFEEVVRKCTHSTCKGEVSALSDAHRRDLTQMCEDFNKSGFRVLAVATRCFAKPQCGFGPEDECDMLLRGCLVFSDPPKMEALPALNSLRHLGISIKVDIRTRIWSVHKLGRT